MNSKYNPGYISQGYEPVLLFPSELNLEMLPYHLLDMNNEKR